MRLQRDKRKGDDEKRYSLIFTVFRFGKIPLRSLLFLVTLAPLVHKKNISGERRQMFHPNGGFRAASGFVFDL